MIKHTDVLKFSALVFISLGMINTQIQAAEIASDHPGNENPGGMTGMNTQMASPFPGDTASGFSLPDQHNDMHSLRDYLGKWVVLYFYPKDMTPGCTTEACSFRDSYTAFKDLDVVILGVSRDSVDLHAKFADKYNLPFTLLSDASGAVCGVYGVLAEKSYNGKTYLGIHRTTFIIDPTGKIAKIYPNVDVNTHAGEILDDIRKLRE